LLGDVVTTTTRMFLVGRTGLGKTQLGYGIARGVSAGDGFLHWRSSRPARVLLIDGEMPAELIKARSIDAIRRAGSPPPEALAIFSRDTEEAFAKQFPSLGLMQPLNTEAGHNFVLALIGALGGIDLVIFDNVMSLLVGDHREETTWAGTLPLVERLTTRRIGQLWLDHTGHNTDRQYGSSTKGWRFDAIGVMSELPEDQRAPRELAITLSFEWPGKARRRTPENWQDFEPHIIRLTDDVWTSEAVKPAPPPDGSDELRGQTRQAFLVLQNRIAEIGQRGIAGVPMAFLSIAENEWREAFYANAMPGAENDAKQKAFRRAADQLVQRSMAAIYNRRVWLCK